MKHNWMIAALVVVIMGGLGWLVVRGIFFDMDSTAYYKTVPELYQMGEKTAGKRLRVAGDVEPGSIVRRGREVSFVLTQGSHKLRVVYTGRDPLPDTFRDRAQAVVDGKLGSDQVFQATAVQAKCASKYESTPGSQHAEQSKKAGI